MPDTENSVTPARPSGSLMRPSYRIRARRAMNLTLTVDHRVVDGRLAGDFLATLADLVARTRVGHPGS